jgi:hypothetical protein
MSIVADNRRSETGLGTPGESKGERLQSHREITQRGGLRALDLRIGRKSLHEMFSAEWGCAQNTFDANDEKSSVRNLTAGFAGCKVSGNLRHAGLYLVAGKHRKDIHD